MRSSTLVILVLILLGALNANAQIALRTYAVRMNSNLEGKDDGYDRHWYFYYNDAAEMDSIYVTHGSRHEYIGLSNVKPFVRIAPHQRDLPPNFPSSGVIAPESERLVITEPEPGKLRILRYRIEYEAAGRRDILKDTVRYDYDPLSNRILRVNASTFDYDVDPTGRIKRITSYVSGRRRSVWDFQRDDGGTVIGIEQKMTRGMRDSLIPRYLLKVLKWQDSVSPQSIDLERSPITAADHLPDLPEGIPAVTIRHMLRGGQWSKGALYESVFDDANRIVLAQRSRSITYDATGPVKLDRTIGVDPGEDSRQQLFRRTGANGLIWSDVVYSSGYASMSFDDRRFIYFYEYSWRYSDSLHGDRMAPYIWYYVSKDTVKLTILEELSTEGLTASLIDTSEQEIMKISLTGRKTTFILPQLDPRRLHAIRWKYRGRKIVDQVF